LGRNFKDGVRMSKESSIEILKYLNFDNGTYLEAGCNDGVAQNNTYTLEMARHWKGILVDASLDACKQCLKNRPNDIIINAALVSPDYKELTIKGDFNGHLMGSVGGKRLHNEKNSVIEVRAFTLDYILQECHVDKLDFLAIDLEGYEMQALLGFNFEKYKPKYCLIEWNTGEDELFPFMESKGYYNLGCISNFNVVDDVGWTGQHNDYLFKLKTI
jgi:FkbM family methyltransferase